MTFSLVGRCARTGMFGIVVTSSSVCVASRCAWARAGAGAVATQNLTNPDLGDLGLALLQRGLPAEAVRDLLVRADPAPAYRQLLVIDERGATASYTGESALALHAASAGADCAAAGNLLRSDAVPAAMVAAFARDPSAFIAERLLAAVEAGLGAGGEVRELRSAGMLVVDRQTWPIVDLRVDDRSEPLTELRRLWSVYQPLMDGYVARADRPDTYVVAPAAPPKV